MFRDPVVVKLECPVEDMGKQIDRVTIGRHATGADVRQVAGLSREEATLRYIELLCALPRETVDQLWTGDIEAIEIALVPFVARTRLRKQAASKGI